MKHIMQIERRSFEAILAGTKSYQLFHDPFARIGDTISVQVGDTVLLQEMSPWIRSNEQGLTGRQMNKRITHITKGGTNGLPQDLHVLGLGD